MLTHFLIALMGVLMGIIFGAIPGMTATMAVAIFLPLTYAYDMTTALFLLLGLYVGGISGGLVPAILINIPGTPSSICTTFDGHPMAQKGEGERALKVGITASFFGGIVSLCCLWLFTPLLSDLAIKFTSVEEFLIILFALSIISALSKGSMTKGIFAGFLGVLTALVGSFSDNNKERLVPSFLSGDLTSGFSLLPVLIGLFAISELLEMAEKGMPHTNVEELAKSKDAVKFSFRDFKGQVINVFRSSLLGTFTGVLPGVGGSAASILSYSTAKNFSKHPEKFGTGIPDGLIASESANNGLTGGALIPLLSLGIPGDSTTAVLMGAFMLQGIQVGPLFITQNPDTWKTILISLLLCDFLMFFVMFFPIKYIAKIIYIKPARLYPIIVLMCVVGAYTCNNGILFDVWTLLLFGLVGYLFNKFGLSVPCYLIGFILGGSLEKYFIDSLKGSGGSLAVFFSHPIGNGIWVLILSSIAYSIYINHRQKVKQEA
jgi:putative tricarboxylic transport membrane protein